MISQSNLVIAGFLRNVSKYSETFFIGGSCYLRKLVLSSCTIIPIFFSFSETLGAKVLRQEGNSPDHSIRCLNWAKSEYPK